MPSKKVAQSSAMGSCCLKSRLRLIRITTVTLPRGSVHWAFSLVLGYGNNLEDNDILDATAIDGSDDFEIDGWLLQDDSG